MIGESDRSLPLPVMLMEPISEMVIPFFPLMVELLDSVEVLRVMESAVIVEVLVSVGVLRVMELVAVILPLLVSDDIVSMTIEEAVTGPKAVTAGAIRWNLLPAAEDPNVVIAWLSLMKTSPPAVADSAEVDTSIGVAGPPMFPKGAISLRTGTKPITTLALMLPELSAAKVTVPPLESGAAVSTMILPELV